MDWMRKIFPWQVNTPRVVGLVRMLWIGPRGPLPPEPPRFPSPVAAPGGPRRNLWRGRVCVTLQAAAGASRGSLPRTSPAFTWPG